MRLQSRRRRLPGRRMKTLMKIVKTMVNAGSRLCAFVRWVEFASPFLLVSDSVTFSSEMKEQRRWWGCSSSLCRSSALLSPQFFFRAQSPASSASFLLPSFFSFFSGSVISCLWFFRCLPLSPGFVSPPCSWLFFFVSFSPLVFLCSFPLVFFFPSMHGLSLAFIAREECRFFKP